MIIMCHHPPQIPQSTLWPLHYEYEYEYDTVLILHISSQPVLRYHDYYTKITIIPARYPAACTVTVHQPVQKTMICTTTGQPPDSQLMICTLSTYRPAF